MARRTASKKRRNTRRRRFGYPKNILKFFTLALVILAFGFAMMVVVTHRPGGRGGGVEDGGGRLTRFPAVVIDAGHGGIDGGTVGNGMVEKNETLRIAKRLRDELESRGIPVLMTRVSDVALGLEERAAIGNSERRLAFVSVHLNAGPGEVAGVETFYSSPKALEATRVLRGEFQLSDGESIEDNRARLLAEAVQASVCRRTGASDRGVKNRPGLAVTRRSHCPAVLVECGFLTNQQEASLLGSSHYQKVLAAGIADGVEQYLTAAADRAYGVVIAGRGEPAMDSR